MTLGSRVVPALLAAALGVLLAVGPVPAAPGAAAPDHEAGLSPLQRYGACLAGQGQGDLLLLMDESGSLTTTDPAAARVSAARYLLDSLTRFSERNRTRISVATAGFSDTFAQQVSWRVLDRASLPAVTEEVNGYRDKVEGDDTDYWWALEGARRELARQADGDPGRCQAVAWFSDGKLDVGVPRTPWGRAHLPAEKPYAEGIDLAAPGAKETVEAAAVGSICDGGGLADQLRASGVVTFAVGLSPDADDAQFDLMRSIATGGKRQDGAACGNISDPVPGAFYPARNIDDLLMAVDELVYPGPTQVGQAHRFVLDSSIGAVHVLGSSDVPDVQAELTLPSGRVVPLAKRDGQETDVDLDGVRGTYAWLSANTLTIDLARPEGAGSSWTGVWELSFVDPAAKAADPRSRSRIEITGDLRPSWPAGDSTSLRAQQVVPDVRFGLVDGQGRPVDPAEVPGSLRLTAELLHGDGEKVTLTAGQDKSAIGAPLDLDLTKVEPGPATLRLALRVTTADAVAADGTPTPGTTLNPVSVDVDVTVRPPLDYPVVSDHLDFGRIEGPVKKQQQLEVTGPGCVWFADLDEPKLATKPHEVHVVTLSSPASPTGPARCIEVAGGETKNVPVTLETDVPGNGTINGTLTVMAAPLGEPDQHLAVPVTVTAALVKPRNEVVYWPVFVGTFLLGLGVPLGIAYALKAAASKIPARPLSAKRVPVTVNGDTVLRDGRPLSLRDDDFVSLVPLAEGGSRHVTVDGVDLRARAGLSPFGRGHVSVSADGLLAGSSDPSKDGGGSDGTTTLPLAVHNTWVLLHDPTAREDEADLLLLVGADTSPAQREELVDTARARVPRVLATLRQQADASSRRRSGPGPDGSSDSDRIFGSDRLADSLRSPFDAAAQAPDDRRAASPFDPPDLTGERR